jgi:hemerythrin superfamily protein
MEEPTRARRSTRGRLDGRVAIGIGCGKESGMSGSKGSKATAKLAGATNGAATALTGYPGIFQHLASEHAEVATMMQRIAGAPPTSSVREDLFPEIQKHLLSHAYAEEQEFYPPLRDLSELEPLVVQCLEDHRKIEEYLDELDERSKATKTWSDMFARLVHVVQSHVEREECQLFPRARDLLSEQRAREIEQRYYDAEQREKAGT